MFLTGVMRCAVRLRHCLKAISTCDVRRAWNDDVHEILQASTMQDEWARSQIERADLVVRALSGNVVLKKEVTPRARVSAIVDEVCQQVGATPDLVQLCAGSVVLKQHSRLGDSLGPPSDGCLELTLLRRAGPAVTAEAMSGRSIKILNHVPAIGDYCHCDRRYSFMSLGDFAGKPGMRYLLTSNDDKMTPASKVMWQLEFRVSVTVHLNFRSEWHVRGPGATAWLERDGWERSQAMKSAVTSGVPNGPYSGPVFSKSIESGTVDLMGSNCPEGTYLVFLEMEPAD